MQSLTGRPVALEDAQADGVLFHLEHRVDARAVEPKVEVADAGEEADGTHRTS